MSDPHYHVDIEGKITEIVAAHAKRVSDIIETACEAALQGGQYGVLVIYHPNLRVTAQVSPHVPYGHIYYWRKDH